jgi:glycosyltransferase involved in cell wall biosynthesis
MARRYPVVVVGPHLARRYRAAPRLLAVTVSLVNEDDIVGPDVKAARSYDGDLVALSVGRLAPEKNPLLLADVLASLRERDDRWRLVVCGEGPLTDALQRRFESLGVAEHAEIRGYVPLDGGLLEAYRTSHALIHVSWTEGVPQILFEAFAAGLPVVATAVGGIPEAAGDSALLVPAGDADAAAVALARLAADCELRERLIGAGIARIRRHTVEAETQRVASFLEGVTE